MANENQTNSILTSIKKLLGITEDYEVFDADIIIHMNTAFTTLTQLGVGPSEGFMVTDKSDEWSDFTEDQIALNSVKTYVYIKTRLVFDPPGTSFAIDALNATAKELEFRLNVQAEGAFDGI